MLLVFSSVTACADVFDSSVNEFEFDWEPDRL